MKRFSVAFFDADNQPIGDPIHLDYKTLKECLYCLASIVRIPDETICVSVVEQP